MWFRSLQPSAGHLRHSKRDALQVPAAQWLRLSSDDLYPGRRGDFRELFEGPVRASDDIGPDEAGAARELFQLLLGRIQRESLVLQNAEFDRIDGQYVNPPWPRFPGAEVLLDLLALLRPDAERSQALQRGLVGKPALP
jgi:hypothetical protein